MRSALTKYTTAKMDENQRASLGGLERRRRWRCREGMALKKEQPGISRVWMILGLSRHISSSSTDAAWSWKIDEHCHVCAQLY